MNIVSSDGLEEYDEEFMNNSWSFVNIHVKKNTLQVGITNLFFNEY